MYYHISMPYRQWVWWFWSFTIRIDRINSTVLILQYIGTIDACLSFAAFGQRWLTNDQWPSFLLFNLDEHWWRLKKCGWWDLTDHNHNCTHKDKDIATQKHRVIEIPHIRRKHFLNGSMRTIRTCLVRENRALSLLYVLV